MSASARRDILSFGAIRAASSVVSFFGAFYLVGIGEAATYGNYLAGFSLAVIINVIGRFGADHTLLRLSRVAPNARLGPTLRARVFKSWLLMWVPCMALSTLAWAAGVPYGLAIFTGSLFAAAVVAGRYLRACHRPRPAALYDPPFMHLFGVGLLCLGASPDMALGLGGGLWVALCAVVFVRTMGREAPRRIFAARLFVRGGVRRLGSIYLSYFIEAAFGNGINLLIQALYGPAPLAIFNTIMKLNFVSEQAQEFQRVFRLGGARGPGSAAAQAGAGGGLKGRVKRLLNRMDSGRSPKNPGSGPVEIAFFSLASAGANALIMLVLLKHDFETVPAIWFYVILTLLQSASLAAGPAIFSIWVFRSIAVANGLRIAFIMGFVAVILLCPPAPELWALGQVAILTAVRFAALAIWRRGTPPAEAA